VLLVGLLKAILEYS